MTTLTELTDRPADGRAYAEPRRAGIGDVAPSGRARLDALARWLQDVAWADVADALGPPDPWIVRRLRVRAERFPAFAEPCVATTWCSATGPAIAERRTSVVGEGGGRVEAVALWVRLDPATARPLQLDEPFFAAYGTAAAGRRARSRLHHPAPPDDLAPARTSRFRAADLDQAGHVNNAVYWALLEEELLELDPGASFDAEVEHRGPGGTGAAEVLADGAMRWVRDASGTVVASFRLASSDA
jgi:acyl-ACP thioesterase